MCEKQPRPRRRGAATAGVCLAVAALSACSSAGEDGVAHVVAGFYAALGEGDGAAACELLAPATRSSLERSSGRPCGEAILEEELPSGPGPAAVTVFDSAARAAGPSDTVFLGRFADGWKVVAAGCTPQAPEHPYDCSVAKG